MDDISPQVLFGKKVRTIRELAEISQEELADLADLDRTYISSIERGKRNVSLNNIFKIAEALEIPVPQLLDFSTNNWIKAKK